MPTYTEFTDTVAEQWVAGLQQLQEVQAAALAQAARTVTTVVPEGDSFVADRLAEQREVIEANFSLAARVLDAQRQYWLGLVDAADPAPAAPIVDASAAAAKAAAAAATSKVAASAASSASKAAKA